MLPQSFWIVFIELRKKILGLIVDQISDVVRVSLEGIGPNRENGESNIQAEYVKGVGIADKGPVLIVDTEKVFLKFFKE